MNRLIRSLVAAWLVMGSGSGEAFTGSVIDRVDDELTFEMIQEDPYKHLGETVLFGGTIMSVSASGNQSTVRLAHLSLDDWNKPDDTVDPDGCLIAVIGRPLDTGRYHPGELLTILGVVAGGDRGGKEESCPVVNVWEMQLWDESGGKADDVSPPAPAGRQPLFPDSSTGAGPWSYMQPPFQYPLCDPGYYFYNMVPPYFPGYGYRPFPFYMRPRP